MFVKMLNQDVSGEEFIIETTTQADADRANRFLEEMEQFFASEGLDVNDLYENETLSDIVAPLYNHDIETMLNAAATKNSLVDQFDLVMSEINRLYENENVLPKSLKKELLMTLRKNKKKISAGIRKKAETLQSKSQIDFEVTIILLCQAMKQRRFVCSGRYVNKTL